VDPAEGIDATMAVIEMFCGTGEALEFEVHHLASDGSTVLTERTGTFTMKGQTAPLPVMGAFHVVTRRSPHGINYFDKDREAEHIPVEQEGFRGVRWVGRSGQPRQ
jgi:limonene-1,2-epoxide hydrolase